MSIYYIQNRDKLDAVIHSLSVVNNIYIGFDLETTGLDPHTSKIRLIQIAIADDVYVLDAFSIDNVFNWLQILFSKYFRQNILTVHNIKFELQQLWANGIDVEGLKLFDTYIASKILYAGLDYNNGLKAVALREIGVSISKDMQTSDWSAPVLSKDQIKYAALDAKILPKLASACARKIEDENLLAVFNLEMATVKPTAAIEYNGIKLDTCILDEIRPIYYERLNKAEESILSFVPKRFEHFNLLGECINPGFKVSSSSQVLELLQSLHIPDPFPNDNGSSQLITSTGKTHIKLLDWEQYPVIAALLDYRAASKLISSYVDTLADKINPVTGRVHSSFNQMVSTGRFSSSNPNQQQIPRPNKEDKYSIRSAFVPEEGYCFVISDYSQIEIRVIAEVVADTTGDTQMVDEFLKGYDPYLATAAALNSMSYEDFLEKVSEDIRKKERQGAKAVRLGFNYAMGAEKFKNYAKFMFGITYTSKQAKEYRDKYFSVYPGLKKYHQACQDKTITDAFSLAPFFRRRSWDEYPGVSAIANHPIQGSSADITKQALVYIYDELYEKGYHPTKNQDIKLILTVHDEIELESKLELQEYGKEMLSRCMVKAGELVLKRCPVEAEAGIGMSLAAK